MLYQRYRPQFFSELRAQDHIKEVLLSALKKKRVGHAYLFSGPRGTGKTSTARLLAKALNCEKPRSSAEPCGKCLNCQAFEQNRFLDLIEIDAASNRGIDNIRDLKDSIMLTPVHGRFKVYIIDEVHMLSKEAFNALLKTLEEPPKNVIFILATTEPSSVPQTIVSRCQRFDFRPLQAQEILESLKKVVKKEKIKILNPCLKLIAVYAQGSLRDAFSFLDQLSSLRPPITEEKVKKTLGVIDLGGLIRIFDKLTIKDRSVFEDLKKELAKGYAPSHLINALLRYLENLVFIKNINSAISPLGLELKTKMQRQAEKLEFEELSKLYNLLLRARFQSRDLEVESLPLEMALGEFIRNQSSFKKQNPNKSSTKTQSQSSSSSSKKADPPSNISQEEFNQLWAKVIDKMKHHNHSLAAFLAKSKAKINSGTIFLKLPFKLYYNALTQPKNLQNLHHIIHKIFHQKIQLKLYLDKKKSLKDVKKIFGI